MTITDYMNRERRLGRTTTILTSAGTTTFTYDFESRATSITGPGISQTNVYNGLDTRTGSTTNSVAQTYLRDGAYVTDPVLKDSSATYTPGVSERRGTATTFLHSGLKNADTQTGTAQTVSATRRYDAFGNVVTSTGIWNGPFGYAGGFGYQEDATGLKLLGHRYYDSSTGRFLTRDPQKDGRNWYTYCWNDPVGMVDQNGQTPAGLAGIGAAVNEAIVKARGGAGVGGQKKAPGTGLKDPVVGDLNGGNFKTKPVEGTTITGGIGGVKVGLPLFKRSPMPGVDLIPTVTQKPGNKGPTADLGVELPGMGGAGFTSSGAGTMSLSLAELYFWAKYEDEEWSGGIYLGNTNLGAGISFAGGLVSITIGGRF